MFLASLAFKNLTRNVGRNALSMVSAVFGVAFLIFGLSFIDGIDESALRANVKTVTGHVQVIPPGLADEDVTGYPTDVLEPIPDALVQRLDGLTWTSRLHFDARLIAGSESLQVMGLGVEERDAEVFPREKVDLDGSWDGLVVGSLLAEQVGLSLGDPVFVQVRTSSGAINALTYVVAGIATTNNPAIDGRAVILDMDQAMDLAGAPGPSQVAIRLDNPMDSDAVRDSLQDPWVASTYLDEAAPVLEIGQIRRRALGFLIFMIMGIAATGIANTVIMAAYERVREIGTLAAMGMSRGSIRRLFITEGLALGLVGSGLGAALGGALSWYLAVNGVDFSELVKDNPQGAIAFDTMIYARFSVTYIVGGMGFGTVVATLASLYPAAWAARLNPADAVRAD